MSSTSEPSEIIGLPEPHVATHAVGTPANPCCTLKPFFSRMPVRYFVVSSSCMPSSPKLYTMSTICCVKVAMLSTRRSASFFMDARCASSAGRLTGKVTSGRLSGPPPPRWAARSAGRLVTVSAAASDARTMSNRERIEFLNSGEDVGEDGAARPENSSRHSRPPQPPVRSSTRDRREHAFDGVHVGLDLDRPIGQRRDRIGVLVIPHDRFPILEHVSGQHRDDGCT